MRSDSKQELERVQRELKTLKEISELVTSFIDLESLLQHIVLSVSKMMETDICSIYLIDKMNRLVLFATIGLRPDAVGKLKLNLGEGIIGYTSQIGEPISVFRSDTHPQYVYCPETGEHGDYSMLAVPLKRNRKSFGVICVQTYQGRIYTADEITFLSTIASQISGAIRNAQLYNEQKKTLKEISKLYETAHALSRTLELNKILKEIVKSSGEILEAPFSLLQIIDVFSNKFLQFRHGFGNDQLPMEVDDLINRIYSQISISKRPEWVDDISIELSDPFHACLLIRSLLSVPIIISNQVVGTISVFNRENRDAHYSQESERLLTILANQAAVSIQNARLFDTVRMNEKQLMDMKDQLLRAERLVAVGEMSARVAHEIRNPLVAIGGFTRRVYEQQEEGSEGQRFLRIVLDEVARLEKILHEILDFASPAMPNLQPGDLHQVLDDTLMMIHESCLINDIRIIKNYEARFSMIYVDYSQIKQVFLNLFQNSMEAMEKAGGELKINTYQAPAERGKGNRVIVTIRDTGCGIQEKDQAHIYDPFYSSKPKGSGLGLPITHKILTAHEASIRLVSREKLGTMVIIEFPLYQEQEGENHGSENPVD